MQGVPILLRFHEVMVVPSKSKARKLGELFSERGRKTRVDSRFSDYLFGDAGFDSEVLYMVCFKKGIKPVMKQRSYRRGVWWFGEQGVIVHQIQKGEHESETYYCHGFDP